jgi:uncharacterized protein (TIGR02687 family)
MNLDQLRQGLLQAFHSENHRIVFWYDPERSFAEDLKSLDLSGVHVVNMESESTFGIKLKLELQDTANKYLLYFPCAEPDSNDDWLLDIKLYSRCFYADKVSLIFNDIGLQQQSLREHLAKREKFLSSKIRIAALKGVIQPTDNERLLDLAMIAVTLGVKSIDLTTLLSALAEHAVEAECGLETNPPVVDDLAKYGLIPTLFSVLRDEVGYPTTNEQLSADQPFNFGHVLLMLLCTAYCESIGEIPVWAKGLVMPSANSRASARSLLSRWRDSSRYYKAYDVVSDWVSQALNIKNHLANIPLETLAADATFEQVEKQIIVDLTRDIPSASSADLQVFSRIINDRLDNYWASRHKDDDKRAKYRLLYSALSAAIELFGLRYQYREGFHYSTTEMFYKAYSENLYRFDKAYRHYSAASQRAHIDLIKTLDDAIEDCYANWYIDQLSRNWGDLVESENLIDVWKIAGIPNQQHFYSHWVKPHLDGPKNKRIVVIISDAFRYEAALELCERINEKRYSEATLATQLGVLPSYTTLGMASLLPHKTLDYSQAGSDAVFVDGLSTAGTDSRDKILAQHNGMAVTAQQVKDWSREAGREALKDQQLIYVYHNVIDDRSDKGGGSESDTFQHVELAIEELTELSRKILMYFNVTTLFITADHGFLFQQSKLEAADRTALIDKPTSAFKSKKRYVLGNELPTSKQVWQGSTRITAGTQSDTQFWIPKGANRFHFVGGARFVHGGAMPQEIVVPVITVNQLRGDKAEQRTKRKVEIISLKTSLKMVNSIQRFDLVQTEAISETILSVTCTVAIYENDKAVSSLETVTFDSASDSMNDRVKQIRLSLNGNSFDRKNDYFLVIKDKDLNTEINRYRVTIDLAFTDDFL